MAGPAAILREIHRLKKNARELKERGEQGPRMLEGRKNKLARQEDVYKQAEDAVKKMKADIHNKETELKGTDDQIKKYERQSNDIMSKKQFEALKLEIQHARDKIDKLSDVILEEMGRVEEEAAKLPDIKKLVDDAKKEVETFQRDFEKRMADLADQREKVLEELKQVEATLPNDIRPQYDKIVSVSDDEAFSSVEKETCMACYTHITPQQQNELLRDRFVLCKSCHRMLYLPQ